MNRISFTKKTLAVVLLLISTGGVCAGINGKSLYQHNCAACHGDGGKGGVGVPLGLESFQVTISDSYLFSTIRNGRPGRVMPAFKRMSDAQIDAIIKYVRRFVKSSKQSIRVTYSSKSIKGDIKAGAKIYQKNCAACHGAKGEGGKGTGVTFSRPRDLPIIAPALANSGFLKSASDSMIKQTLVKGRKGTPMVSFLQKGLKMKDIDNVVAYIRSFEKLAAANEKKLSHDAKAKNLSPVIKVRSEYDLKTTVANLQKAVAASNYKLIRTQYLNQGLVEKGKENKKQVILYFCNFNQLNTALAIDPRVGLFLPCRLTVAETKDGVFIYAVNSSRLSQLYNNAELSKICGAMRVTYMAIIEEATL